VKTLASKQTSEGKARKVRKEMEMDKEKENQPVKEIPGNATTLISNLKSLTSTIRNKRTSEGITTMKVIS
jgi:hypothetical protein